MRRHALLVAMVVLLLAADAPKDKAAKKELQKFQGTWTTAMVEVNGQKVDRDNFKHSQLIIKGNKFTLKGPDGQIEGTFTIDPTKKPKTLDVKGKNANGDDIASWGIYELKGATLKVCYTTEGEDHRPTEFKTKDGSKTSLVVYKRKKK